jgi:hypothetical protein
MDRHVVDPYSLSYPFVHVGDTTIQMWYGSNQGWGKEPETMRHVIKYAESVDGMNWKREGIIAIDLLEGEIGVARPFERFRRV